MSGTWTIEGHRPHGAFSILTTTELEGYQRQVAVVEAEDDAHGMIRDHNSHDKLVEALGVALKARCDQGKCGQCEDLHDGYMGLGPEHGAQPTEAELNVARTALEEAKP